MTDQQFLDKCKEHAGYMRLLDFQSEEKVDAAMLRLKNGKGTSETYYEYRFTVETEALSGKNQDLSDFFKDINAVFDKYKNKGIIDDDWDTKGGSTPMGLGIVRDVLKD